MIAELSPLCSQKKHKKKLMMKKAFENCNTLKLIIISVFCIEAQWHSKCSLIIILNYFWQLDFHPSISYVCVNVWVWKNFCIFTKYWCLDYLPFNFFSMYKILLQWLGVYLEFSVCSFCRHLLNACCMCHFFRGCKGRQEMPMIF